MLASLLGMSISLVPCLMFGLIIMISFLLCNCESIGETVHRHFCAWKNRRKTRSKSSNIGFNSNDHGTKGTTRKSAGGGQSQSTSTSGVNLAFNVQNTNLLNLQMNPEEMSTVTPTPTAPFLHSQQQITSSSRSKISNSKIKDGDDDPPPAYEECFNPKKIKHQ